MAKVDVKMPEDFIDRITRLGAAQDEIAAKVLEAGAEIVEAKVRILDFFGIHSPSKKFAWIGEMMVEGLAGSIEDNGDEAIKAAEDLSEGIDDVMQDVSKSMTEGVPTKFNIKGSVSGVKDPIVGGNGLQLQLNISTFNNYSAEDVEQLTNEIMATAGSFIRRQREVFA